MTSEGAERFLDLTIYSWDVTTLLHGIVDYLEFSERNLDWQRRREIAKAREEASALDLGPENAQYLAQAQDNIIEGAEYRFDLSLSQNIRYSSLTSYVTAVEWCARLFKERLIHKPPKRPDGKNEAVHIFRHLNKTLLNFTESIDTFEKVVYIRNCVVHSAGIVKGDRYETELRQALEILLGFGISTAGIFGERIHIDAGAVDAHAREALEWLPEVDKICCSSGKFKQHA